MCLLSLFIHVCWSPLSDATAHIMGVEFGIFFTTMLGSAHADSLMSRQTRAMGKRRWLQSLSAPVQQLLSVVCDAVITLVGRLCLEDPSPAPGALLYKTSPQPFCGVPFSDVFCCTDRDRFRDFIAHFVRPQCMQLHMRDADGGRVGVQIFHRRLEGLHGDIRHVIGIREESEGHLTGEPPDVARSFIK